MGLTLQVRKHASSLNMLLMVPIPFFPVRLEGWLRG